MVNSLHACHDGFSMANIIKPCYNVVCKSPTFFKKLMPSEASGWCLQFAAPDVAHATGVTVGFIAGNASMEMDRRSLERVLGGSPCGI